MGEGGRGGTTEKAVFLLMWPLDPHLCAVNAPDQCVGQTINVVQLSLFLFVCWQLLGLGTELMCQFMDLSKPSISDSGHCSTDCQCDWSTPTISSQTSWKVEVV